MDTSSESESRMASRMFDLFGTLSPKFDTNHPSTWLTTPLVPAMLSHWNAIFATRSTGVRFGRAEQRACLQLSRFLSSR